MERLEFVRGKLINLKSVRGKWTELAKVSGISSRTLYNLVNEVKTPDTNTINKLFSVLKGGFK